MKQHPLRHDDILSAHLRPAPWLMIQADVGSQNVRVRLTAPLRLPLKVPGGPESARIGATGAAVVVVDE
jgi:hypothetical protein